MTPSSAAAPGQDVLAGTGLMLLGTLLYAVNDVMGKWLAGTYPPAQIMLIRSIAALLVLAPVAWRLGVAVLVRVERPRLQLARALLAALEVTFFYWAVSLLPLADAMTYYMAAPIYVTAFSALLLAEPVGWRRWTAVAVGFSGVVVALQPSPETLSWGAAVAIAGSLFFALLMVATRRLRRTPDIALITWQVAGALAVGAVAAPFDWVTPGWRDGGALALLGIVSMIATVCVNRSLRLAPASAVVPYQYTLIVWAVLFGYLAFGDVPALPMILGATIIIGAGLFIFLREQVRARQAG